MFDHGRETIFESSYREFREIEGLLRNRVSDIQTSISSVEIDKQIRIYKMYTLEGCGRFRLVTEHGLGFAGFPSFLAKSIVYDVFLGACLTLLFFSRIG